MLKVIMLENAENNFFFINFFLEYSSSVQILVNFCSAYVKRVMQPLLRLNIIEQSFKITKIFKYKVQADAPCISDDSLWIIRIMAIDILKLKFTKILLSVTLIFQFVLTAIEFYFFVCIFSFTDIVKYSPLFFGMIYVIFYRHYLQNRKCFLFQAMLNIAAVLLCSEIALSALTDFKL
jgi:hypothetical protein